MIDEGKYQPVDDAPEDKPIAEGPSPWQPTPTETPEVDAATEGEATYLADDQMSLGSKLRGGGRDQGDRAGMEETRLCPACGRVTTFIDGSCTNCQHKLGTAGFEEVQHIRDLAMGTGENPLMKVLLIVLVAVVLVAIGIIFLPRLFASKPTGDTPEVSERGSTAEQPAYPGGLSQVTIDRDFKDRLSSAIIDGNAGWKKGGVDCYVYRYRLVENVVPALSQEILVTAFVGGGDWQEAIKEPGAVPFRLGTSPFIDSVNASPGVEASISLVYTGGDESPALDDTYVRYGYYFGKEHMERAQEVLEALRMERFNNGQYPDHLEASIVSPPLATRGGFFFTPNGFGYLPVYKTDSRGNIIMGTGAGIASFMPEEVVGYYLVMFAPTEDKGIDLYSDSDMAYYAKHIQPFPYSPPSPVTNMPMNPDGSPDGIACVFKDGELLED